MQDKIKAGLIGRTLKHSYSKVIHSYLGDYDYDLYEIEPENLQDFVKSGADAFNVTIPYKSEIIKYLDHVDENALNVGAVNTVVKKNGLSYGYNTDFNGMIYVIKRASIEVCGKNVMILGSGGTSKTARAVARFLGAKEITVVSRSGEVNYSNCGELKQTQVIINTTPVGMYPDNYSLLLSPSSFPLLEGVVDVVYNPSLTRFCFEAREKGIKYTNGLPMLVAQAKYASELFTGRKIDDGVIEDIVKVLEKQVTNVVLIGMPGGGKTTIGKEIARRLNREFIDTDAEVEKMLDKDIPSVIKEMGEPYFRKAEMKVVQEVGKLTGKVIATGGGVVKNAENLFPLLSNGKIFWIDRDVNLLALNGRPLSNGAGGVNKLYEERKGLYQKFSQVKIKNDADIDSAVEEVMKNL